MAGHKGKGHMHHIPSAMATETPSGRVMVLRNPDKEGDSYILKSVGGHTAGEDGAVATSRQVANAALAERIAHSMLCANYDDPSQVSHYDMPLEFIQQVVGCAVAFVNAIWHDDMRCFRNACQKTALRLALPDTTDADMPRQAAESAGPSTTNADPILRFLSRDIYDRFAAERLVFDALALTWTKDLMEALLEWMEERRVTAKEAIMGGSMKSYGFQQAFKEEAVTELLGRSGRFGRFGFKEARHATGPTVNGNNGPRSMGIRGLRLR